MKVAIIGAGFTGLTAAYRLLKKGHSVVIFEKNSRVGGLAMGFKLENWNNSLEHHYHHIFKSDKEIIELANEINEDFKFYRPNTSSYVEGEIFQIDSPINLLKFSKLSIFDRFRMGAVLVYFKFFANYLQLEKFTAHSFLKKAMGNKGYSLLWEPLMKSKFGPYYKDIALSWFYARIKSRTTQLGYPASGFQSFADNLAKKILNLKGEIFLNTEIVSLEEKNNEVMVYVDSKKNYFDKVIVTTPNNLFAKIATQIKPDYKEKLLSFKGIGAINMVLELDQRFFKTNVYWLSICDSKFPFLALVEHTNMISSAFYNNKHLLYIGNYLPENHEYFKLTKEELLKIYDPFLKKFNAHYKKYINSINVFSVPFAQPVVTTNYSLKLLSHKTPIKNVYLANMQQVYPWDRGTNFAVSMGNQVANLVDAS